MFFWSSMRFFNFSAVLSEIIDFKALLILTNPGSPRFILIDSAYFSASIVRRTNSGVGTPLTLYLERVLRICNDTRSHINYMKSCSKSLYIPYIFERMNLQESLLPLLKQEVAL